MVVLASRNVTTRLQLLREQYNYLMVCKSNGYKLNKEDVKDFNKQLEYCRNLVRKELINCPITSLLK